MIENVKIVVALLDLPANQQSILPKFSMFYNPNVHIIWSQYDLAFSVVSTKNFDFSKVVVDSQKDNLFMFFVY